MSGAVLHRIGIGKAWTPLDLGSKLKAWWAPLEGSNYTLNGSNIASWTDEIGGYVLSQATAASQPAYSAAGYGGQPCAVFDGVDDNLVKSTVPAAIPQGTTPGELWAATISNVASSTTLQGIVSQGDSTHRRGLHRLGIDVIADAYPGDGTTTWAENTSVPINDGVAHVLRGVFGTSVRMDVDGVAGAGAAISVNDNGAALKLGAAAWVTSGVRCWNGAIRQVLITDALTSGEAALLLSYLNG